jgi:hypothetical protein
VRFSRQGEIDPAFPQIARLYVEGENMADELVRWSPSWALAILLLGSAALPAQPDDYLSKISPGLLEVAKKGEPLSVFIELQNQPHAAIRRRAEQQSSFCIRSAEARLAEIAASPLRSLLDQEFSDASREAEAASGELRMRVIEEIDAAIKPDQDHLEAFLNSLGATGIHRYHMLNMLTAVVPAVTLPAIAQDPEIAYISAVGILEGSAAPKISVEFVGAPKLWHQTPPVTGKRGPSLAILDSGINQAHPAFANKNIFSKDFLTQAQNDKCWGNDAVDTKDHQGHGTAVADIAAGGGGWQGVAPDLDPKTGGGGTLYNLKVGFNRRNAGSTDPACTEGVRIIESDLYAALDAILLAPNSGLPQYTGVIVNLSANFDETPLNPAVQGYDETARRFDRLVDNNSPNVTVVVSAGNTGWSNDHSVPKSVGTPATAYNVIGVAAQGVVGDGESQEPSLEILDTSSEGPAKDGRHKPDIAAPGTNINAARFDFGAAGIPPYKHDFRGTSMAAPHVAGAAALVGEAIATSNTMALKALLLNEANRPANTLVTKNFPNDGLWNSKRGWGLLDLKNFPQLLRQVASNKPVCEQGTQDYKTVCFLDQVAQAADIRYYEGTPQSTGDLSATLVWNRHFHSKVLNAQPLALNNLFLTIYEARNNQYVKVSASESAKDNVQMVTIPAHANDDVLVKVHLNGALNKPDNDPGFAESFALAVSAGLTPKQAPSLKISCAAPPAAPPLQKVTVVCTASNAGQLPLSDTTVVANPGTVTGGSLGTMKAGATASFAVNATAPAQPGSQVSVAVNAAGTLAEDTYRGSTSIIVSTAGGGSCDVTIVQPPGGFFVPHSGLSGTFQLNTSSPDCHWTLGAGVLYNFSVRLNQWITVSPASGTGSTVISYVVLPNLYLQARNGGTLVGAVFAQPAPDFVNVEADFTVCIGNIVPAGNGPGYACYPY